MNGYQRRAKSAVDGGHLPLRGLRGELSFIQAVYWVEMTAQDPRTQVNSFTTANTLSLTC